MPGQVLEVRVGERLWFDGRAWSIASVGAVSVRLVAADGQQRSAAVEELMQSASAADDSEETSARQSVLGSIVLAGLTRRQRERLDREVAVFSQLLNPLVDGDASVDVERAARELGTSTATARRRLNRFRDQGPSGLVDRRLLGETRRSIDPRWDEACLSVMASYVAASNPSRQTIIRKANEAFLKEAPEGSVPSRTSAYRRLVELDKGRYTFGEAKQRRSVAKRPQGVLGQLRPTRPGQYILMDGYRLDVFAMEPVTMRWVNTELTVAMDLFDRSIKGIRLRPVAAKSADVASVLFQCLTPQVWGRGPEASKGPFAGVPEHVVLGSEGVFPDTIVIDHGKVYMSQHTMGACRRLGISIQPAIPNKPTDKPALERFFRTLRLSLLDQLEGYKGPNVYERGRDVEKGAFYYVSELEQIIREWIGDIYHRSAHRGLRDPHLPHVDLSPEEMFNRGIEISGLLRLPAAEDLRFELLEVAWRKIHHYGIDIDGRRYDGEPLNPYRGRRSDHGGAHAGKWPFHVDVDDIRTVYFQDPENKSWHPLQWRLAPGITAPFSKDAADYTRRASVLAQRHVDPQQAVQDLLVRWQRDEVTGRREKVLAQRLAAQEDVEARMPAEAQDSPDVIDLLTRRAQREDQRRHHPSDVDVFERYYEKRPEGGLEVFDD